MRKTLALLCLLTVFAAGGVAIADDPDGDIGRARDLLAQADAILAAEQAKPPIVQTVTETITQTVIQTAPPAPAYPPPSTETDVGAAFVTCEFTHRLQVDPIVAPGQTSAHMHDFFGNASVRADSTYESMTAAFPSVCDLKEDTAGYWAPSLQRTDGTFVAPIRATVYYRNRPYRYGTTTPFPADFRMIAGGSNEGFSNPVTWWNCENESDESLANRRTFIPDCGPNAWVEAHVYFPNCWDGVHTDSPDHRSHVVYAREPVTGEVTNLSNTAVCPASHPVKVPQIDFRILYPSGTGNGSDYTFSDGTDLAHADFWNTWQQPALERVVQVCLQGSVRCGQLRTLP